MNDKTEMALSGACATITLCRDLSDVTVDGVLDRYFEAYHVAPGEREVLRKCFDDERVAEICSDADYYELLRTNKYFETIGEYREPDLVDKVAEIKGKAAIKWRNCGWNFRKDVSRSEAITRMSDMTERGYIHALTTIGMMMCEGIFLPLKPKEGLSMLLRAARWNDVEAMYLCLHYLKDGDRSAKDGILCRLITVLKMQFKYELIDETIEKYGRPTCEHSPEAEMLEKMFGRGIVNRDAYSRAHARVLYSSALSVADKSRMLFSGDRSRISELAQLPLDLDASKKCDFDSNAFKTITIKYGQTQREISVALDGYATARIGQKPLCISAGSQYVRKEMTVAIKRTLGAANFMKVPVASVEESGFDRTRYNVFLRGYDEKKLNIVLIDLCGELSENKVKRVAEFLDMDRRRVFALHDLGVTLDVGALMPLCICDKANEAQFRRVCNVVRVSEPSREQREEIVAKIAEETAATYGYASVSLSQDAVKELSALSLDEAAAKLESVTRKNIDGGDVLTIDEEALNKVGAERQGYGFGGYGYENK